MKSTIGRTVVNRRIGNTRKSESALPAVLMRLACACALAPWIMALPLYGQSSRGSLLGQIADSTHAGVPGATVKIVRIDTHETFETRTDDRGYYSFPFLAAGSYTLTATARGFKTAHRDSVLLQTDDTLDLVTLLEVGDVNDRVSVGANSEKLQTTTASRSYRVDPEKLKELPLIGRQAYSLVGLTPGVIFTQEQFGTTGFAGLRGWDANGKFIINGGREGTNQFLLDGAPVSLTGRWQFSPNVDAIQEFKVMTNTYDAQFGRTGGGTVLTTLKSGTNEWHGGLFEYFHNAVFDANTTQGNSDGLARGKHITHQYGGTIGGPIIKDKDFLFFSFEGFREIVPFPVVSDAPPLDLRDGQHFSKYNLRVYDPLTAHPCVEGVDTAKGVKCFSTYIRKPFARASIPLSRISPIGRAILDLYPAPNAAGFTQNYIADGNSGRYRYDQPMGRWDHTISDRDRVSLVATWERGYDFASTNGFPAPADLGNSIAKRLDQNYVAEWVHVFSPSAVFDMRASFGRFTEYFPGSSESDFTSAQLGILQIPRPPSATSDAPPHVNLDLFTSIIGSSYSWSAQTQWSLQPGVIQTHGRHVIHWGGEFAYAAIANAGSGRSNGEFSFNRSWSQQYVNRAFDVTRNIGPRDGSGVADLLLGIPASGFVDYNDSYYRSWPYYGFYFQDTWKVAKKLTLNLGLRYDVQIPFRERFNRVNDGFDFTSKNPLSDQIVAHWADVKAQYDATNPKYPYPAVPAAIYGGRLFAGSSNRRPYDTDWTNIQPRLGAAWTFAPNTVLRGGIGSFYRTATQLNQTNGFDQRTNYVNSFDGIIPTAGKSGPYSLEDPFPDGLATPTGSSLGLLTNAGRAINYDGRQRPIPRTIQYSIGVQRELPWGLMFEATYAGSRTSKDSMTAQLDAPSYGDYMRGQADPAYLNRRLPNPFFGILPTTSDFGSTIAISAFNLLRPYPLFNGIAQLTNPWARYRYDSFQLLAERRVLDASSAGIFSFLFAYTFSKSFEDSHRLNDWNLAEKPVHELSALDKPQTLALSAVWDLPFGWGRKYSNQVGPFVGALINGWSIDWIFTYNSGYPVARPDATFTCASYDAPGGSTAGHWFNNDASCWQARAPFTLRTYEDRFSSIRNPSAPQLHVSAEKTFWLSDRYSMQFRGESFNLTNTPILPGPNTNFRDPRFGQLPIQQNNFPRYVQLAVKLVF